jgi:hypothetical protein
MKRMKCNQLGGACDHEFIATTFDEMAALSRQHAMEMYSKNDLPHVGAMEEMQFMMHEPGAIEKWFKKKEVEFNNSPEQN